MPLVRFLRVFGARSAREIVLNTLEKIPAAINTRGRLVSVGTVDNLRLRPNFSPARRARQPRTSEELMPLFARRSFLIGAALAPLAPALGHAQASGTQAWPTRPVTLIIPFPAG